MKTYTFKLFAKAEEVVVAVHMQLEQFYDSVKMTGFEKFLEKYPESFLTASDYHTSSGAWYTRDSVIGTLKGLLDTKANAAFMDDYDEPTLSVEAYRRLIYSGYVQMPFILTSRRPAIGRKWIDEHIDEVPKALPSFKINKVKYFDDRLKVLDEILLDEAKEARASVAEAARINTERRLIMPEGVRMLLKEQEDSTCACKTRDESSFMPRKALYKG